MSAANMDTLRHDEGTISVLTPRLYQLRVLATAIERNTLAFLPTGSGKTLIAVMLIKHYLDIGRSNQDTKRVIAFVAPTKVLVDQQRAYIAGNCDAVVKAFTGETRGEKKRLDTWNDQDWRRELAIVDVLVMTPEVLRDALSLGLIDVSVFSLFILDECHHATGNHPMSRLCEHIRTSPADPRIFGLTASPLNTRKGKVETRIAELEKNTNCKLATALEDMEELFIFNRIPDMQVLPYAIVSMPSDSLPVAGTAVIHRAYLRARHSFYLFGFYHLLATLRLSPDGFPELAGLHLPPSSSMAKGYFLDDCQQLLLQLAKIHAECGPLAAICAVHVSMTARDRRGCFFTSTPTSKVNIDKINMQVTEILECPYPVHVLLDYERTCIASLLDCLCGLIACLPPDLKEQVMARYVLQTDAEGDFSWQLIRAALSIDIETIRASNCYGSLDCYPFQRLPAAFNFQCIIAQCCKIILDLITPSYIEVPSHTDLIPWEQRNTFVGSSTSDCAHSHVPIIYPKVLNLFSFFLVREAEFNDPARMSADDSPWACIVFCKMRLTCQSLSYLFNLFISFIKYPTGTPAIRMRFKYMTGHTSLKEQVRTMLEFKTGLFNVLIASEVVEEGIDVKICELVVNFDLPETLKSFIQRRGRARAINSSMIVMVPLSEQGSRYLYDMDKLLEQDQQLNSLLHKDSDREACSSFSSDALQRYTVWETRATIDTRSSVQTLVKYCQKSQKRRSLGISSPIFWTRLVEDNLYQCALLLPPHVPPHIRCFVSTGHRSRGGAIASVALDSVIALHTNGQLNNWLHRYDKNAGLAGTADADAMEDDVDDEGETLTIDVKYVPDSLTFNQALAANSICSQGTVLYHIYGINVLTAVPEALLNNRHCCLLLEALRYAAVCLPIYVPPAEAVLAFKLKDRFGFDCELKYLGMRDCSALEVMHMQRYHRAVICFESDSSLPNSMVSPEQWSQSSNGAHYVVIPLQTSIDELHGVQENSSFDPPLHWLTFLMNAADQAQEMISNLLQERQCVSEGKSKPRYELFQARDAAQLLGKVVCHRHGFLSLPIEEGEKLTIRDNLMLKNGKSITYAEYYLSKGLASAEAVKGMVESPSHHLLSAIGVPGNFIVENFLGCTENTANYSRLSTIAHLIPETCEIIGNARDYFLSISMPAILWRAQSMQLAKECLAEVHNLYMRSEWGATACDFDSGCINPSISLILEAITPRMCQENIDSERLEMLGDSVLKLLIGLELYQRYPEYDEGDLTKMRSAYVCNEFQAKCAEKTGIIRYLRAIHFFVGQQLLNFEPPGKLLPGDSPHSLWNQSIHMKTSSMTDANPKKISGPQLSKAIVKMKRLADLIEALVGAFFLQGGLKGAEYAVKALGIWPTVELEVAPLVADVPVVPVIIGELYLPQEFPWQLTALAMQSTESAGTFEEYQRVLISASASSALHRSLALKSSLESKLGYTFSDAKLLEEALTHSSVIGKPSYERLEFLGDAALDLVVVSILHSLPSNMDPGQLSINKCNFTNNFYIGNLGIRIGLYKHINIFSEEMQSTFKDLQLLEELDVAENIEQSDNQAQSKLNNIATAVDVVADCFEAIMGAVLLDSNYSLEAIKDIIMKVGLLPPKLFLESEDPTVNTL